MTALYRRLLGDAFDRLPDGLRRFHAAPGGGRAHGVMRVTRSSGAVHRAVGWVAGFPEASEELDLALTVKVEGDRERWIREFGRDRLESVQWQEGDLLAEAAGGTTLLFRLQASERGLVFRFAGARMLGVPLPRYASPSAEVEVLPHDDPDAWRVDMRLRAPMLGRLLRYEGIVRCEPGV
jgi:hypothetical protein